MSWLRKRLEEAEAQLNFRDGGRTAATVRAARSTPPPAVTTRNSGLRVSRPQQQRPLSVATPEQTPSIRVGNTQVMQSPEMTNAPLDRRLVNPSLPKSNQTLGNRLRDVLDANTPMDRYRRQQQGREAIAENPGNIVSNTVGSIPRLINTVGNQIPEVYYTGAGEVARLTGNEEALNNAVRMQDSIRANYKKNSGGLFNAGTLYDAEEAKRGDLATGVRRIGGGTLEAAADVAGFKVAGVGAKQIANQGLRRGITSQAGTIARNIPVNAVGGAANSLRQDGSLKDVATSALLAGTVGTVADVGLGAAGAGIIRGSRAAKPITTNLVNRANNVTTNLVSNTKRLIPDEGGFIQVGRTPKKIHPDDQRILVDLIDHARGVKQLSPEQAYRVELDAARVAERYGIPTPNTLDKFADAIDNRLATDRQAARRPSLLRDEGGYAKNPFYKEKDLTEGLTEQQADMINDYAEMLEGMGAGNGVDITPDGRRISNNFRDADTAGRNMTKADWFEKARKDIESGKAGFGVSEDYRKLPTLQDALDGKSTKIKDPMQSTWDANPFKDRVENFGDQPVVNSKRPATSQSEPVSVQQVLKEKDIQSSQANNTLPVFETKRVSNLDKAFRDTQSIIERQGEKGREISSLLDKARDTKEIYLSELQQKMPTVTRLARKGKNALVNKDFENFVDATQGLAKPKNGRVAKAVAEWQATHPQIRQRAVDAGLEVGDLGPNYYPHFVDYDKVFKDKNTYNQSINHLVQTGQAKNAEDAMRLLSYARDVSRNREFGNLEASRIIDLPFYDKTPNSLISYLNGSVKRISQVETFGKGDEKVLKLISEAGMQGYDTEAMKNAFDVASGAKQYNPTASKISGNIRKYVTTTRLGLGALTNISQNVNTGIVTGHTRTLLAGLKQVDPKTRQFVSDTGVISDALLNDIKTQQGYSSFTSKVLGKGINKITAPFFGTVEKFNRSVAATAGRDYALRLAQKGDEVTLRKLGVTGKIGKELTEAQQVQAARKIVEKTQFKVDPQDLPGWADSPGGKLVSQFRTFSYNQSKFFSNEILKPAAKGNVMPLARLFAALPVGYALYETKRVIAGRPEEENKTKVGLSTFQNIGGAGIVFDLYQSLNPLGSQYIPSDRRTSMAVGAFGGPAVGVATQGVGAVSELIQRKDIPRDEADLENKLVLGRGEDDYTDATPIARFGLQQIPIVGTPIKNRLLPFESKDSQSLTKEQKEILKYQVKPEDRDKFTKDFIAENEKEKAASKEKAKFQRQSSNDSKKLSNGKYYGKIGNEYKTFDTEQAYKDEKAKEDFKNSSEKSKVIGDTYYYKTKSGEVKSKDKVEYEFDKDMQGVAVELDKAKTNNDLDAWNAAAEKKYNALLKKRKSFDPETEFDKIDAIDKQLLDIQQDFDKYSEQGYIKKSGGKRGKASKYDYKLFDFGDAVSINKSLRQLLNEAIVRR